MSQETDQREKEQYKRIEGLLAQIPDADIEERIFKLLAQVPQGELLKYVWEIDQVHWWMTLREFNCHLAACWWAKKNEKDDPIEELKRGTKADKLEHELIWTYVYQVNAWLDLLRHFFGDIRQEFERELGLPFPFPTSFDLFLEMFRTEGNNNFLIFLDPYQKFSATEIRDNHDLLRQSKESLPPHKVKKLEKLAKSYPVNFWHLFTLKVFQQVKPDSLGKTLLKTHENWATTLHDLKRRVFDEKRRGRLSASSQYSKSFEVRNGVVCTANKYGGGYS